MAAHEFKVVHSSGNTFLLIDGKGTPAQVVQAKDKTKGELYRFLIRDDRLGEFFPSVAEKEQRIIDLEKQLELKKGYTDGTYRYRSYV